MRFALDPRVAPLAKVLAVVALIYTLFPFDLVPDLLPVVGWLDDAGVLALGFWLLARAWRDFAARAEHGAQRPPPTAGEPQIVDTVGTDLDRR